jgi:uncharacterized tellurite resistance protein B-like protein
MVSWEQRKGDNAMADTKKFGTIVAFSTAALLADGVYEKSEKLAISSIAETLKINGKEMFDAIDVEIEKQAEMSDEDLDTYLKNIAKELNENDMIEIFQVCLVIILSDGNLCKEETAILLSFADILNIDAVYATLIIAYMVNKESDLVVEIDM